MGSHNEVLYLLEIHKSMTFNPSNCLTWKSTEIKLKLIILYSSIELILVLIISVYVKVKNTITLVSLRAPAKAL